MADNLELKLHPDDATPAAVYVALARQNASAYPKGDCMPCGATIRTGFFFDGAATDARPFGAPRVGPGRLLAATCRGIAAASMLMTKTPPNSTRRTPCGKSFVTTREQ